MHQLGEPVVRGLGAAVLEGRGEAWLHELAGQALSDCEFARAIAAGVLASAGEHALHDAMTVAAGPEFTWDLDPDQVIDGQRCGRHAVFCCLACTDETLTPVIALRGQAFGR